MERITMEQHTEGTRALGLRQDARGLWGVYECSIKTGYHGTRRYASSCGTYRYKSLAGARRALQRWGNGPLSYMQYADLDVLPAGAYFGESISGESISRTKPYIVYSALC